MIEVTKNNTLEELRRIREEIDSLRKQLVFKLKQERECAVRVVEECKSWDSPVDITNRELQILNAIMEDPYILNKQVAGNLSICERTVKFHVSSLLRKYNATDRRSLIERVLSLREQKETIQ